MKNTDKTKAIVNIVILTAIIIFVNMLASEFFFRLDFTENKRYTISDSTKELLRGLDSSVTLKFYISEDLPTRVLPVERDIRDTLEEYRRYGGGNVQLSVLVPEKDEDIEQDAQKLGIQQAQVNVVGENRQEAQNIYMGISMHYLDKSEVIPVVTNVNDLEYQLTSRILKLSVEDKKKIVFLDKTLEYPQGIDPAMKQQLMQQMGPSHSINEDMRFIAKQLKEQYIVEEKAVKEGQSLPENTETLIINGPSNLTEWEKYIIDQHLVAGGKVVLLKSAMKIAQGAMAQADQLNYADLLASYGITINNNYVMDQNNYSAMIPSGNSRYVMPFPLWVKVSPRQISEDLPETVRDVGALGFTFASSISINEKENLSYMAIVESSSESWTREGTVVIDPQNLEPSNSESTRPHKLAVLVQGKFPSSFDENSVPESASADSFAEKGSEEGALFVLGSSEFMLDHIAQRFSSNILFFQNMIDYLSNNDVLTGIRSRRKSLPPVDPDLSDTVKNVIKWLGTILMPLMVIIFGISRMFMRKSISGRV
ncbi:MAG: GldG family protein [bacterium]